MSDTTREQAIEQAAKTYREIWLKGDPCEPWENVSKSARHAYVSAMTEFADRGLLAGTADTAMSGHGYKGTDADGSLIGRMLADHEAEVAKLRAELHNAEMTIDTLSDPVAREILAGNTTEDDWEEATAPHLLTDGGQS